MEIAGTSSESHPRIARTAHGRHADSAATEGSMSPLAVLEATLLGTLTVAATVVFLALSAIE